MSGMYYAISGEQVRLGDRVRIHRWVRPNLEGEVCYIPGVSPKHKRFEWRGTRRWAVQCEDGTLWQMPYLPEHFTGQPPNHIVFLGRTAQNDTATASTR